MTLEVEDSPIDNWDVLRSFLPAGWQTMARESAALGARLSRRGEFVACAVVARRRRLFAGRNCGSCTALGHHRQSGGGVQTFARFRAMAALAGRAVTRPASAAIARKRANV